MSNRTSEANKAIALAWSKEQQLIREGRGTRDWTPIQQQEILDRGKAYGDDGKAFEGHHMKSAEKFPEYQGDPENIQFLSRPEHFAAHDGNFQNPTNGFFNPTTGETKNFVGNRCEPCEICELSNPIIGTGNHAKNTTENAGVSDSASVRDTETTTLPRPSHPKTSRVIGTIKHFAGEAVNFYIRHKNVIKPIVGLLVTCAVVAAKETPGGNSKSSNSDYADDDDYTTYSPNISEENNAATVQQEDIIERSSPSEHTVSAHRQRYNGEWRDKKPYQRGKPSDE